jgi:hypothetical protein
MGIHQGHFVWVSLGMAPQDVGDVHGNRTLAKSV